MDFGNVTVPFGNFVVVEPLHTHTRYELYERDGIGLETYRVQVVGKACMLFVASKPFAVHFFDDGPPELSSNWIEVAGVVGESGVADLFFPMPKGKKGSDGKVWVSLAEVLRFAKLNALSESPVLEKRICEAGRVIVEDEPIGTQVQLEPDNPCLNTEDPERIWIRRTALYRYFAVCFFCR